MSLNPVRECHWHERQRTNFGSEARVSPPASRTNIHPTVPNHPKHARGTGSRRKAHLRRRCGRCRPRGGFDLLAAGRAFVSPDRLGRTRGLSAASVGRPITCPKRARDCHNLRAQWSIELRAGGRLMAERQYVAYYRISRPRPEGSGLSIEGQRSSVLRYVEAHPGRLVEEFAETESGRNDKRPQLIEALRICRTRRATLLIARLDRLSRNFALISNLCESDIDFVAVDLPEANRLTIHLLAAISEYEATLISDRIKAALAVAKSRGVKLGGNHGLTRDRIRKAWEAAAAARRANALAKARDLAPLIWGLRRSGRSCRRIAEELDRLGVRPLRGARWYDSTVHKIPIRTCEEFSPNGKPYTRTLVNRLNYVERAKRFAP